MMWGWKMTFGRTSNDPKKSIDQSSGGLSGSGKERDRGERKKNYSVSLMFSCTDTPVHLTPG